MITDIYKSIYSSILGDIILLSNEEYLIGLYFSDSKTLPNLDNYPYKDTKVIKHTKRWLDLYFNGYNPLIDIPMNLKGTKFQLEVWDILKNIPYGKTLTYSEIARKISISHNIKKMANQAVGHAVSANPISIIIPCHRVVSKNGIEKYAANVAKKKYLLTLESNIIS